MMDGHHCRVDIQAEFMRRHGRLLFSDELEVMIEHLESGLFLEGAVFEAHVAELTRQYREAPCRPLRDVEGLGAPSAGLAAYLDEMLAKGPAEPEGAGQTVGLIAPHLDYQRGGPCYSTAYRHLARRTSAERFVILGTNHFGLSRSVVGTRKGFETPFGVVPCDEAFLGRVGERCGADLCAMEYDHAREHSVELQVVLLKHVLGGRRFSIAPYLCPDACGPTGLEPADGEGVDLRKFAEALREAIAEDATPTCVIAAADLSHVGRYFSDERELSETELKKVGDFDKEVLAQVRELDAERVRSLLASEHNPTNICSTGCLYAFCAVMAGRARAGSHRYLQAVTRGAENCVTCAAMDFVAT